MRMLALVFLLGCSGDTPPEVDADPRGPKCSGQVYDSCSTEHDCAACRPFADVGLTVCSQPCTPGDDASCPQPMGGMATCDSTGFCKPSKANMCHL